LMEPGGDISKSEPRQNCGKFLPINNLGAIFKSHETQCWRALATITRKVDPPQTEQNNSTILNKSHHF